MKARIWRLVPFPQKIKHDDADVLLAILPPGGSLMSFWWFTGAGVPAFDLLDVFDTRHFYWLTFLLLSPAICHGCPLWRKRTTGLIDVRMGRMESTLSYSTWLLFGGDISIACMLLTVLLLFHI